MNVLLNENYVNECVILKKNPAPKKWGRKTR